MQNRRDRCSHSNSCWSVTFAGVVMCEMERTLISRRLVEWMVLDFGR